jgi:hypothetical protein
MFKRIIVTTIAALVASTATAITPASAATFTWSSQPFTNLKAEGAVINGGFINFPTKSGLYIQQCAAPAVVGTRPTNCLDLAWVTTSGAPQTVSPNGVVTFTLKANFNGRQGAVDCFKTECGVFFRLDHLATADTSEDTYMKISFAPATGAVTILQADTISVTLNGQSLTKNVPVDLAYRAPAKIVATAASGLPVTVVSATPECSYQNGKLEALKGAGVCAINVSTAGDSKYDPARANFPFILKPGAQKLSIAKLTIAKGKTRALPVESNFGQTVSYKSNSKNCRVESNLVEVKGPCVLTASAPAKTDLFGALSAKIVVKNK